MVTLPFWFGMSNAPAIVVDDRSSEPPSSATSTSPLSAPTNSTVVTFLRLAMVWFRISVGSVSAGSVGSLVAGAHHERERGEDRCERKRGSTGHEVSPDMTVFGVKGRPGRRGCQMP